MAISTYCKADEAIDVAEFIDFVESNINLNDDESVVSGAAKLQALANNKRALIDLFNRDLLQYQAESGISYSQSSSILGIGRKKDFIVRTNLWPPKADSSARTIEEALFSYELPHDHNFSFLTANYFGPGYVTDIWEIVDPDAVCGYVSESVSLKFLERTTLEPGKQMYFRRRRDVHVQHPPQEFSVSLNLLIATDIDRVTDQFEFDVKNKRISGFPRDTIASRRSFFLEAAGCLGNQNTLDILLQIAEKHPCQRTRAAALKGALNISPNATQSLTPRIKGDTSPFIREILKTRL